jgi:hypothetical protein
MGFRQGPQPELHFSLILRRLQVLFFWTRIFSGNAKILRLSLVRLYKALINNVGCSAATPTTQAP